MKNHNEIDYPGMLEKLLELVGMCKEYNAFEFEGLVVRGLPVEIAKEYLRIKPSKKFRTWLIDSGLVEKEI